MRAYLKSSIVFILLLTMVYVPASAQKLSKKEKKAEKQSLREGDIEFESERYTIALPHYLKAYGINKSNAETNYRVGVCYIKSEKKSPAVEFLERAFKIEPKIADDIYYQLGKAYQFEERYEDAIIYFKKFSQETKIGAGKDYKEKVDRHIYECNNGIEFRENPVEVEIINLGKKINSKYHDYSPVVSADESVMIFTSRRDNSTGGKIDMHGFYFEDLFISKKDKENEEWGAPRNMSEINSDVHEASVGLSPDGKKLIIFKGDVGNGDLFYCKQDDEGAWVKPKRFPKNISDPSSWEPSGVISPDMKTLYFVSNRKGGFGGLDIYKSQKGKKGKWGKAENLGPTINTSGNEESPFLDIDGKTLYFSSDMHKGMGEDDIFKSIYKEEEGKWTTPENLGYPINSPFKDIYFVLSGNGSTAYFNSVKEGGVGGEDLYMIKFPDPEDKEEREELVREVLQLEKELIIEETEEEPIVVEEEIVEEKIEEIVEEEVEEKAPVPILIPVEVVGEVMEKGTERKLSGGLIELQDQNGTLIASLSTDQNGQFNYELGLDYEGELKGTASLDGYIYQVRNTMVPMPTSQQQRVKLLFYLDKPVVNKKIVLRNIYFDFDRSTLKQESYIELSKLVNMMQEDQSMSAEIAGHCDHIGSEEYNTTLSRRRSKAVYNYLIKKGIAPDRLTYKGYGESQPLASNDDEEEGRELNRRTEFIIKGL